MLTKSDSENYYIKYKKVYKGEFGMRKNCGRCFVVMLLCFCCIFSNKSDGRYAELYVAGNRTVTVDLAHVAGIVVLLLFAAVARKT